MYEEFKNDLLKILNGVLEDSDIQKVASALDYISPKYDISAKETSLDIISESNNDRMLKRFIATKRVERCTPKTIASYTTELTKMFKHLNMDIMDIDVYALRMYLAQFELNECKSNTIKTKRSIICSFFGWLHRENLIPMDPSAALGTIKSPDVVRYPYSKVEIDKMRLACSSVRNRAILEFMLSTGCRVGEVASINISDINFDKQEVKVLGKGNKERIVYFDALCAEWMHKYLSTRTKLSPALFASKKGDRLTVKGIQDMCYKLAKDSGVSNVHPHRFRRTLATSLIRKNVSIQDVAAILGHDNINTTMTYIHMDNTLVKSVYERFAA